MSKKSTNCRTRERNKSLPVSVKSLVHIAGLALTSPIRLPATTFTASNALLSIKITIESARIRFDPNDILERYVWNSRHSVNAV